MADIRWTECELIESVEGKCGGQPVVVGTRVFPDPILNAFAWGETLDDIHEGYPSLSPEQIMRLIEFAREQRFRDAA